MSDRKPVVINPETLKSQVESGMKRKELAQFYNIPESQMKLALHQQGLKIRKFHHPAFVFESGTSEEVLEGNTTGEIVNPVTVSEDNTTGTESVAENSVAEQVEWKD